MLAQELYMKMAYSPEFMAKQKAVLEGTDEPMNQAVQAMMAEQQKQPQKK